MVNTRTKKIGALLMAITILFGTLFTASASSTITGKFGENVTYSFDEATGVLSLRGTGTTWSSENGRCDDYPLTDIRDQIKILKIGEGITGIGAWAFSYCENLTKVEFPSTLQYIGKFSFIDTGLYEMDIPEGVTYIGQQAFWNCDNLTRGSIPSTAEFLDGGFFGDCDKLESVYIKCKTPSVIADGIFDSSISLKEIKVDNDNQVFSVDADGNLFISHNQLYQCPLGKAGSYYTVPDGTVRIWPTALRGSEKIRAVFIPSSVKKIDSTVIDQGFTTDFYYEGSEEEWKAVNVGENNYDSCIVGIVIEKLVVHYNATEEMMIEETEKMLAHEFGEWEIEIAATPTSYGKIKHTCKKCGFTEIKDSDYVPGLTDKTAKDFADMQNSEPEWIAYNYGDIDFDGKITAADARLALRAAVGLETYKKGTGKYYSCDVDSDGKITSADARLILRGSVGLEDITKWMA